MPLTRTVIFLCLWLCSPHQSVTPHGDQYPIFQALLFLDLASLRHEMRHMSLNIWYILCYLDYGMRPKNCCTSWLHATKVILYLLLLHYFISALWENALQASTRLRIRQNVLKHIVILHSKITKITTKRPQITPDHNRSSQEHAFGTYFLTGPRRNSFSSL